jgi:hypothetical protein
VILKYSFDIKSAISCGTCRSLLLGEEIETDAELKTVKHKANVIYILIKKKGESPLPTIESIKFDKIRVESISK